MRNVAFSKWEPLRDLLALRDQLGHLDVIAAELKDGIITVTMPTAAANRRRVAVS